jgi:hypothetical protein
LIWLLHGRQVVALTEDAADIETATGTVSYRRYNKPALGPLGDSLDDFALVCRPAFPLWLILAPDPAELPPILLGLLCR